MPTRTPNPCLCGAAVREPTTNERIGHVLEGSASFTLTLREKGPKLVDPRRRIEEAVYSYRLCPNCTKVLVDTLLQMGFTPRYRSE